MDRKRFTADMLETLEIARGVQKADPELTLDNAIRLALIAKLELVRDALSGIEMSLEDIGPGDTSGEDIVDELRSINEHLENIG